MITHPYDAHTKHMEVVKHPYMMFDIDVEVELS